MPDQRNLSSPAQDSNAAPHQNHEMRPLPDISLPHLTRRAVLSGSLAALVTAVATTPSWAAGPWGGYENGRIPASALTRLSWDSGEMLHAAAAASFERLNIAYRGRFGKNIAITDSYRDYDTQVRLKREKGGLAATPGKSNHGWGHAVDLGGGINVFDTDEHRWMREKCGGYGWIHPAWAHDGKYPDEAWHFEYTGAGAAVAPSGGGDPDPQTRPNVEDTMKLMRVREDGRIFLVGELSVSQLSSMDEYHAFAAMLGPYIEVSIHDMARIHDRIAASVGDFVGAVWRLKP